MKKLIVILFILFVGCNVNYADQVAKLKKMGMDDSCINYIIVKLDKKASPGEKLIFAKSCNNVTIFKFCGGQDALQNNELKFLKCLTNLK
jgi:hypothetical protein